LYGNEEGILESQRARYRTTAERHREAFDAAQFQFFSTPGRVEIAGNHTDHNGGLVMAGSVDLDSIAAASKTGGDLITVYSDGFDRPFVVDVNDLQPKTDERGKTSALIRGIAARIRTLGYRIGGFNACLSSNVGIGSGLSSSASVEMLICTIVNTLFNDGGITVLELAKIGRFAENRYFNKPCGLMDQISCGFGGIVTIDFEDAENPLVHRIDFDFHEHGYDLLVVRTGSDHADLTEDYASITREMHSVAALFGKNFCRELTMQEIMDNVPFLRAGAGDRALLRTYHFLTENERVKEQVLALRSGNIRKFLNLVHKSGNSSAQWLQNSFSTIRPESQPVSLALALTEHFFKGKTGGAYRVHGGGFAGTIQVYIPKPYSGEYIHFMERRLGYGAVAPLRIRPVGSVHLNSV
jgi:galactokinase